MTLPAGVLRREPVSLLLGVGILGFLLLGTGISVLRFLRRREVHAEVRFDPPEVSRDIPLDLVVVVTEGALPRGSLFIARLESGSRGNAWSARFSSGTDGGGEFRFALAGTDRGLYRISGAHLVVPDPFGLTKILPPAFFRTSLLRVLPRVQPVSYEVFVPGAGVRRRETLLSREREGERVDVRPYVPGDDISRIHWKVYAHTGDLFLRIPEELPPPSRAVTVLVDRFQPDETVLDRVIEAALGLAEYLEERDHRVTVAVDGTGAPVPIGAPAEARSVLAALDHRDGLREASRRTRTRVDVVPDGGSAILTVTSGRASRCPNAHRGDWIVLLEGGTQRDTSRRLAPLYLNR